MNGLAEDCFESDLIARHIYLEEQLGDGDGGNFLSGWQCINPWRLAIEDEITGTRRSLDPSTYLYADAFPEIEHRFTDLHQVADRSRPERIIFGGGSTQLLHLIVAWMRSRGVSEVFYLAPMYHTLHWSMKALGIRPRPVNGRHPFELDFSFNLPDKKTILIVTDPIWYAGVRIRKDVINEIVRWQSMTGSIIVVDGSFQYMEWAESTKDVAYSLDPSLTMRVVCPTKQLVLHGYRAGYVLMPEQHYREMSTLNSMMFASLSIDTIALLLAVPSLVGHLAFPRKLMALAAYRHAQLRRRGYIHTPWSPDCGYFCFEKLEHKLIGRQVLMNGGYFGQKRYLDHYRVNLMSPQITLLCGDVDSDFSV